MITFQQESVFTERNAKEWNDLFEKHYQEIAWRKDKIALKPDMDKYRMLESKDMVRIYTAREDGILVGYAVWFIMNHAHYSDTKIASNDILYIDPVKRGGRTGLNLIKFSENELVKIGVQSVILHIKKSFDWGKVAERMGYDAVDTIYQKWTGE